MDVQLLLPSRTEKEAKHLGFHVGHCESVVVVNGWDQCRYPYIPSRYASANKVLKRRYVGAQRGSLGHQEGDVIQK